MGAREEGPAGQAAWALTRCRTNERRARRAAAAPRLPARRSQARAPLQPYRAAPPAEAPCERRQCILQTTIARIPRRPPAALSSRAPGPAGLLTTFLAVSAAPGGNGSACVLPTHAPPSHTTSSPPATPRRSSWGAAPEDRPRRQCLRVKMGHPDAGPVPARRMSCLMSLQPPTTAPAREHMTPPLTSTARHLPPFAR